MHYNRSGRKYISRSVIDTRYSTIASEENSREFEVKFIQPPCFPPVVLEYHTDDYSFYIPPYNCNPYVMEDFIKVPQELSCDWDLDYSDDFDDEEDVYEHKISSPSSRSISQNILNIISPIEVDTTEEIPYPSHLYIDNAGTNSFTIRYQRGSDYYYYPQD